MADFVDHSFQLSYLQSDWGFDQAPPFPPCLNPHDFEHPQNAQTGEGQLEQPFNPAVFAYRSDMGPVLAPPTHRKGSIHRHFSPPREHRNRVLAQSLLHPNTLRGSMWCLYHPVYTCYGRKSHTPTGFAL